MKKIFSVMVFAGMLFSLTAFTVGCGDGAKKSPAAAATSPAKTTTPAKTTSP